MKLFKKIAILMISIFLYEKNLHHLILLVMWRKIS